MPDKVPPPKRKGPCVWADTEGCRIGFIWGRADRKVAAVKDASGYTEEVVWDPPHCHRPQLPLQRDRRRAEVGLPGHLRELMPWGGSAAGVYTTTGARWARFIRGIRPSPRLTPRFGTSLFGIRETPWGSDKSTGIEMW